MDFLNRKLKINNWEEVTYPIMTQIEADEKEIPYTGWREVKKGRFGLSDDGYVAECLAVNKYKDAYQVVFPYGRMWITPSSKLLYEPHRNTGEYSQCGTLTWEERESALTRTKNAVNLYVNMFMQTGKIDWKQLGQAYRPDQQNPSATVKRLFKQERIKGMVDTKIQEYLDKRELDQGDVLDIIADAGNRYGAD